MTLTTLIAEKEKEFEDMWLMSFDGGEFEHKPVFDKCTTFLSSSMREAVQAFVGELEGMKKSDLDLAPGFNITAEYRLGEIRGRNNTISDIQAKAQEFLTK